VRALLSFLLSMVMLIVGIIGPWYWLALPLSLALYTLFTFKREVNRGRGLAVWAAVICIGGGSFIYAINESARVHFSRIGESVLTALSAEAEPAERDTALALWTWSEALEEDAALLEKWRTRYDQAAADFGPWTGEMLPPSIFKSVALFFSPPDGAKEIGSDEEPPDWSVGSVLWVPAAFERGTVYLALVMHGGGPEGGKAFQSEFKGTDPVALFGDLRFYRSSE